MTGRLGNLALARAEADRSAVRRGDAGWLSERWARPETRVLQVYGQQVAVWGSRLATDAPRDVPPGRRFFLGEHRGAAYFAVVVDEPEPVREYAGLRRLGGELGDLEVGLVVHAIALANWHATHTFCARCGAPTESELGGHVRRCTSDGSEHYPRTDPAVIMTIVDRDDRLLLGRQATWDPGHFSTLAGFVEPGESLEAAVRREVHEEAGVQIGRVDYLGSQPWPFPSSLMVGFRAEALTTETTFHDGELAEARWFRRHELRRAIESGQVVSRSGISISQRLVEHWYGGPLPLTAVT